MSAQGDPEQGETIRVVTNNGHVAFITSSKSHKHTNKKLLLIIQVQGLGFHLEKDFVKFCLFVCLFKYHFLLFRE